MVLPGQLSAGPPAPIADGPALDTAGLALALRPLHRHLGITRVARQTGLDRLGIACAAAIRPNSATLASHQGKGLDDAAAEVSAVMEAAEYHFAEVPAVEIVDATASAIRAGGSRVLDVAPLMPQGWTLDEALPLRWVAGRCYRSDEPVMVPLDAVQLGQPPRDLHGISRSTNGLAAGTSREGALLHALCELVERDAVCLFGFRAEGAVRRSAIAPQRLADAGVDGLVARIAAAGCEIALFDLTTTIGVPAMLAVLRQAGETGRHFDIASGAGCHPVPAIAARRAILEAAQTRLTHIAGARDDIAEGDYSRRLAHQIGALAELRPGGAGPVGLAAGASLAAQLDFVLRALTTAGLDEIVEVPLGGARLGIPVLKLFVPGLEDRLTNRNWRPGARAASAMLRFW